MRCAISSAREIDYRYHRLGSDIERLDHLFRIIKLTAREVNNQSVHKLSDNNSEYKLVGFVLISSVNKISVSTDLYLKYHIPLYTYFTVYFAIPRLSRSFKMPLNVKDGPDVNGVLFEDDAATPDMALNRTPVQQADNYPKKLVWRNIILFGYLHLAAIYGAYLFLFSAKWQTDVLAYFLYVASGLGITAGAHRLWAHKSYKAKWPLRVILIIFNTIAFQDSALDWSRDHRMHHKYSETDADPHNATRGFFFSHIGWLLVRKHPEIKNKGKGLDLSDLYADPILRFQKKYYLILMPLACFILPTVIPVYYWGETWTNAFFVATLFRYTFILNVTWLVNSAAHKWGGKPYDKNIKPSENLSVALFAFGEGFHNYHHTFPWDYKTAELGNNRLNFTTNFINFFAKLGWAYDMKTVSDEIVQSRVKRTGDGSHHLWGWGDKDQPKEEAAAAIRINPKDD